MAEHRFDFANSKILTTPFGKLTAKGKYSAVPDSDPFSQDRSSLSISISPPSLMDDVYKFIHWWCHYSAAGPLLLLHPLHVRVECFIIKCMIILLSGFLLTFHQDYLFGLGPVATAALATVKVACMCANKSIIGIPISRQIGHLYKDQANECKKFQYTRLRGGKRWNGGPEEATQPILRFTHITVT